MAKGKFSNNGIDTFDSSKQFIGVRLQRGVPLLDRDWNEAEDVRRYFERQLRLNYFGSGVPDTKSFQILEAPEKITQDFLVSAGRCLADGYDVWNPRARLYSELAGEKLPANALAEKLAVFLKPSIGRITSLEDATLGNPQDINLETCVRDRLEWRVGVARAPQQPPAGSFLLAVIERPANTPRITQAMITDMRRSVLNLRSLADENADLRQAVSTLTTQMQAVNGEVQAIKRQLARLFWEIDADPDRSTALFGESVQIRVKVVNGLQEPVQNAFVTGSVDWGALEPGQAVTDKNGVATLTWYGVESETPPTRAEVGVLSKVVDKVKRATLSNPGAVQYQAVSMEPDEMSLVSRYTPAKALAGLSSHVPQFPIVAIPLWRSATVTIHVMENPRGAVRATSVVPVRFGMWVRDWTLTKIHELVTRHEVSARVGDFMRRAATEGTFNQNLVENELHGLYRNVIDDTHRTMKAVVFNRPELDDDLLSRAGTIGQTIAHEVNASVGVQVNKALDSQFQRLQADANVPPQVKTSAEQSKTRVLNGSLQINAGMREGQRQMLNVHKKS